MTQAASQKVLVCASGSGGHLFPARYVIEALQVKGAEVLFVGAGTPLEEEIIAPTGVDRRSIRSEKIMGQGPIGLVKFALSIPSSFRQIAKLITEFQPDVVIGIGGYATFWPVSYAALRRIPTWIHEAEMKPGLANSVLSYYATRVSTAFPEVDLKCKQKLVYTGQPVRKELQRFCDCEHKVRIPSKILILGGSQGANSLDKAAMEMEKFLKLHGLSVWHQCRRENRDELEEFYQQSGVVYKLMPFIRELPEAYEWADVIVSRAGAGAIAELGMVGKPCVLVPYPHAQGNHQTRNAQVLVDAGKAVLVEEGQDFAEQLRDAIFQLLDKNHYSEIASKKIKGRPTNAADAIASGALALVSKQN